MLYPCVLALALAAGCQGRSKDQPTAVERPAIELHQGSAVAARVVPGHPCRATVDGVELLVGGPPLIAQVGNARWTGEDAPNGTTLRKDGVQVARLSTAERQYALFDPDGVPFERAFESGDSAKVTNAALQPFRTATKTPRGIELRDAAGSAAAALVTGTDDLLLAALLGATEAPPEVRALAACSRLFPRESE